MKASAPGKSSAKSRSQNPIPRTVQTPNNTSVPFFFYLYSGPSVARHCPSLQSPAKVHLLPSRFFPKIVTTRSKRLVGGRPSLGQAHQWRLVTHRAYQSDRFFQSLILHLPLQPSAGAPSLQVAHGGPYPRFWQKGHQEPHPNSSRVLKAPSC